MGSSPWVLGPRSDGLMGAAGHRGWLLLLKGVYNFPIYLEYWKYILIYDLCVYFQIRIGDNLNPPGKSHQPAGMNGTIYHPFVLGHSESVLTHGSPSVTLGMVYTWICCRWLDIFRLASPISGESTMIKIWWILPIFGEGYQSVSRFVSIYTFCFGSHCKIDDHTTYIHIYHVLTMTHSDIGFVWLLVATKFQYIYIYMYKYIVTVHSPCTVWSFVGVQKKRSKWSLFQGWVGHPKESTSLSSKIPYFSSSVLGETCGKSKTLTTDQMTYGKHLETCSFKPCTFSQDST